MVLNEEPQLDEEDWSNDWKDYTNMEYLKGPAPTVRKQIMSLRPVFSFWPAPEKEIDSETMTTSKVLEHFFHVKDLTQHLHKTLSVIAKNGTKNNKTC